MRDYVVYAIAMCFVFISFWAILVENLILWGIFLLIAIIVGYVGLRP